MTIAFIGEMIFELVFGPILELFAAALNAVIGIPLAATAYWLSLVVRRRVWHLDRPLTVETPDGVSYSLEVPGLRLRTPVTRRLAGKNSTSGESAPEWDESDKLHPMNLAKRTDNVLIVVAPLVLVAVLFILVVLLIELIVGLLILAVVSVLATVIRHRWTCVVAGPDGEAVHVRAKGLRRIRRTRDALAESIRTGDLTALEGAADSSSRLGEKA